MTIFYAPIEGSMMDEEVEGSEPTILHTLKTTSAIMHDEQKLVIRKLFHRLLGNATG